MRAKSVPARKKGLKKIFRAAKGFEGGRSNRKKAVLQATMRSEMQAFIGRKLEKRKMRELWITRLNIASRELGVSYSRLIAGLNRADIRLDRKQLSELAIHQPEAFKAVVEKAKAALAN